MLALRRLLLRAPGDSLRRLSTSPSVSSKSANQFVKYGVGLGAFGVAGYVCQDDLKKPTLIFTRLTRDLNTAVRIMYDYKVTMQNLTKENEEEEMQKCHQRSADKILDLCFQNGGIYIKLGQHMGQMDHLLPEEYVLTMRNNLLDKCPVTPIEDVEATFLEDFGKRPQDMFTSFSPLPIASASLAQVHVATDATGRKLAVKVQHPGLRENADADITTVEYLVRSVSMVFSDFDYDWLVQQIKDTLPNELNFRNEAANAEICRRNLRSKKSTVGDSVHVPLVLDELSSERVLTMEFVDGVGVTDRSALRALGADPSSVAKLVSRTFNEMIFSHGYVHCDPHAANMLVRKKDGRLQLVLLDHGLYKRIDDEFRFDYAALWHSLVFADEAGIKKYSARMNAGDLFPIFSAMLTQKTWNQIIERSEDHLSVVISREEAKVMQHYSKLYAKEITHLLQRVPEALVLLLKTNDCLRCVDYALGQPVNTISITARQCSRALAEQRLAKLGVFVDDKEKSVIAAGALLNDKRVSAGGSNGQKKGEMDAKKKPGKPESSTAQASSSASSADRDATSPASLSSPSSSPSSSSSSSLSLEAPSIPSTSAVHPVRRPSALAPAVLRARLQNATDLFRVEVQLWLLHLFMLQKQAAGKVDGLRAAAARWGLVKPPPPHMPEMMLTVITEEEEEAVLGQPAK